MSTPGYDFWQDLWDKYGDQYQKQAAKPSLSDFQVWCDEQDLIMDDEVYING